MSELARLATGTLIKIIGDLVHMFAKVEVISLTDVYNFGDVVLCCGVVTIEEVQPAW